MMFLLSVSALLILSCWISSFTLTSASSETRLGFVNQVPLRSSLETRSAGLRRRDAFAKVYVLSELASRHPYLAKRDALPEASPQLALLGGALRTAGSAIGKGLSKIPEKAGKKMGKEQGENAGQKQQDQAHQKTADMMAGNLKKMGYKDADPKCLKQMVDTFSISGGVNGNYSGCWTKPPKAEQHQAKMLEEARKKMPKPSIPDNSVGAQMDRARKAVYGH